MLLVGCLDALSFYCLFMQNYRNKDVQIVKHLTCGNKVIIFSLSVLHEYSDWNKQGGLCT